MGLKEWFRNYTQTPTATKIQHKFKPGDLVEVFTIPKLYAIVYEPPIEGYFGKMYKCKYLGDVGKDLEFCLVQEHRMAKHDLKSET
jgi:hypothetical protein